MYLQSFVFSLFFSVISWLLVPHLFDWLNKPIYQDALSWYPWILLLTSLNALSMVPHYALYAMGGDRSIITSHILSLICFLCVSWFMTPLYGILAVFWSLNLAFLLILIFKNVSYKKILAEKLKKV